MSVVLVLHLAAVFVAPLDVAIGQLPVSRPLSESRAEWPLVPWLAYQFRPYLDAAYLNHGYHFFAPDPGWSSLVHYTGERADGTTFEGTFPDLQEQWPRLRYHRHFMLTEQRMLQPPDVDVGYARHLLRANDAEWVRLDAVTHFLSLPEEVLAGMRLDDPRQYESREIITVTADEAIRPAGPVEESSP